MNTVSLTITDIVIKLSATSRFIPFLEEPLMKFQGLNNSPWAKSRF